MNFDNDEETLEFVNRLLERLHQAGHPNKGSKIEIVYVASGRQHVETQVIAYPQPLPKGREKGVETKESFNDDTPLSALFREKWKVFETLWKRKNMYHDYYQAFGQRNLLQAVATCHS